MIKIIINTFIKATPALLLITAFTVYGYLLLHGYDLGSVKAKKNATTYFYIGIIGYVAWLIAFIFTVYYYHNEKKNNENFQKNGMMKSEEKSIENKLEENKYSKFCTWAFNIWVVYTVAWVMKLPYTYDDLYILLGVIAGVCWWRSKKANKQKDLKISEDK
jgi:Na+/H+-translocating membrane pyrophosphatase